MLLAPGSIHFGTFLGALSAAEEQLYTVPLIVAHQQFAHHYTSVARLRSILSGRQIWASDTTALNDPNEVVKPIRVARSSLSDQLEQLGGRGVLLEGLLGELSQLSSMGVYTVSLSRDGNSSEMWDRYGDHGNGVNLEIDCSQLTLTEVREGDSSWVTVPSDFLALQVEYFAFDDQFAQSASSVVDVATRLNLSEGPVQLEACLNLLFRIWAASLKDAAPWSVEREVRFVSKTVVLPDGSGRYWAGSGPAQTPEVHLRPDGRPIRHLAVSLTPAALRSVTLGPATTSRVTEEVEALMAESGFDGSSLLS